MADLTLKQRLRALLERSGKASSRASSEAGLSETAIRDILEDRVRSPKHETLERLARQFNTTVAYLTGAVDSDLPGATPLAYDATRLRDAVEAVADGLRQHQLELEPDELATFVVYTYEELMRQAGTDGATAGQVAENVIRFEAHRRR